MTNQFAAALLAQAHREPDRSIGAYKTRFQEFEPFFPAISVMLKKNYTISDTYRWLLSQGFETDINLSSYVSHVSKWRKEGLIYSPPINGFPWNLRKSGEA